LQSLTGKTIKGWFTGGIIRDTLAEEIRVVGWWSWGEKRYKNR